MTTLMGRSPSRTRAIFVRARIWHSLFFLPLAIMPEDERAREGVLL